MSLYMDDLPNMAFYAHTNIRHEFKYDARFTVHFEFVVVNNDSASCTFNALVYAFSPALSRCIYAIPIRRAAAVCLGAAPTTSRPGVGCRRVHQRCKAESLLGVLRDHNLYQLCLIKLAGYLSGIRGKSYITFNAKIHAFITFNVPYLYSLLPLPDVLVEKRNHWIQPYQRKKVQRLFSFLFQLSRS